MAYRNSAGFVYLRFETVEGAMAAQSAMHLRWFARRLISALFMVMYCIIIIIMLAQLPMAPRDCKFKDLFILCLVKLNLGVQLLK